MKPKRFNDVLFECLDAHFSRIDNALIGDSFVWSMRSGELIWFVRMDYDGLLDEFSFLRVEFAPVAWVKEDYSNTKQAPMIIRSQLVDFDSLTFVVDYSKLPGRPFSAFFISGLNDQYLEYRRQDVPEYFDLDARRQDLNTFFDALKAGMQRLTTLDQISALRYADKPEMTPEKIEQAWQKHKAMMDNDPYERT
ncbi:hypothetical protein [Corynebacterium sp. HMSC29G08]|uniref:hypothetical protein n=1 Tax=Corynebacterium sp. HMSC29G08 TaxID=1581069 RepID=UPI0008A3313E|nr:hypothetical protein [Corynebacterium sp. HMSC29G08]OFT83981.1 hypothetical protein HMPREF3101_05175 [Corynebacterium sp. HMSC29G08]